MGPMFFSKSYDHRGVVLDRWLCAWALGRCFLENLEVFVGKKHTSEQKKSPLGKGTSFSKHTLFVGLSPLPVRVTTRIITFLVRNPYKPSFPTVTGWGGRSKLFVFHVNFPRCTKPFGSILYIPFGFHFVHSIW